MPHNSDSTEWTDEIPCLFDLDGRGGLPGVEYLYCDSAHEYEAQRAGWQRIGTTVLQLAGPKGSSPFVVMRRGDKAPGLSPESTMQPLHISTHLCVATGLGPADLREPGEPTTIVDPTIKSTTVTKGLKDALPDLGAVA